MVGTTGFGTVLAGSAPYYFKGLPAAAYPIPKISMATFVFLGMSIASK
jgi:hypothetical protein